MLQQFLAEEKSINFLNNMKQYIKVTLENGDVICNPDNSTETFILCLKRIFIDSSRNNCPNLKTYEETKNYKQRGEWVELPNGLYHSTKINTPNKERILKEYNESYSLGWRIERIENDEEFAIEDSSEDSIIVLDNLTEGKMVKRTTTIYERINKYPKVRKFLFDRAGGKCQCCCYDFNKYSQYGEKVLSATFELHHIKPISEYKGVEHKVDLNYIKNYIKVLCPNCHNLIHAYMDMGRSYEESVEIIKSLN